MSNNNKANYIQYINPKINTSLPVSNLDNNSTPFFINLKKDKNSLLRKRDGLRDYNNLSSDVYVDMRNDKFYKNLTLEHSNEGLSGFNGHILTDISTFSTEPQKNIYFGLSCSSDPSKIVVCESGLDLVDRNVIFTDLQVFQYNQNIYFYFRYKFNTPDSNSTIFNVGEQSCLRMMQLKSSNNKLTYQDLFNGLKSGIESFDDLTVSFVDHNISVGGGSLGVNIPTNLKALTTIKIGESEPYWTIFGYKTQPIYSKTVQNLITGVAIYNEILFISLYDTQNDRTFVLYAGTQLSTTLDKRIALSGKVLYMNTFSNFIVLVKKNEIKKIVFDQQVYDRNNNLTFLFKVESILKNFNNMVDDNLFTIVGDKLYLIGSRSYAIHLKESNQVYLNENYLEPIDIDVNGLIGDSFIAHKIFYNKETNNLEIIASSNNNIIANLIYDTFIQDSKIYETTINSSLARLFSFTYEDDINILKVDRDTFAYWLSRVNSFILKYDITLKEWFIDFYMGHIFTVVYNDIRINGLVQPALEEFGRFNKFEFDTPDYTTLNNRRNSNLMLAFIDNTAPRSPYFHGDGIYPFNIFLLLKNSKKEALLNYTSKLDLVTSNWIQLKKRDQQTIYTSALKLFDSITYANGTNISSEQTTYNSLNSNIADGLDKNTNISYVTLENSTTYINTIILILKSYQLSTILSVTLKNQNI